MNKTITNEDAQKLIDFTLARTKTRILNKAIKEFSVQVLYSKHKNELKSTYPELMPTDLWYSIAMSEAFEEFKVPEIECKYLDRKLKTIRKIAVSRHLPMSKKAPYKKEYNELVLKFNELIEPQNKLIKRYKKVQSKKTNPKNKEE